MFKSTLLAATAAVVLCADMALADKIITVSCYRGPWNQVIWDKANPEFVDSLVANGYDAAEAESIAQAVCRDPRLVYNPRQMVQHVREIVAAAPQG